MGQRGPRLRVEEAPNRGDSGPRITDVQIKIGNPAAAKEYQVVYSCEFRTKQSHYEIMTGDEGRECFRNPDGYTITAPHRFPALQAIRVRIEDRLK